MDRISPSLLEMTICNLVFTSAFLTDVEHTDSRVHANSTLFEMTVVSNGVEPIMSRHRSLMTYRFLCKLAAIPLKSTSRAPLNSSLGFQDQTPGVTKRHSESDHEEQLERKRYIVLRTVGQSKRRNAAALRNRRGHPIRTRLMPISEHNER